MKLNSAFTIHILLYYCSTILYRQTDKNKVTMVNFNPTFLRRQCYEKTDLTFG